MYYFLKAGKVKEDSSWTVKPKEMKWNTYEEECQEVYLCHKSQNIPGMRRTSYLKRWAWILWLKTVYGTVALHLPPYRTLSNYTPRDGSNILCRNWITFQVQPIRRKQRRTKWKFTYWMARLPNPSPFHLPSPRRLRALYKRWENSFWRNGIDTKKRQTY